MTTSKKLFWGLMCVGLVLFIFAGSSRARLTGTDPGTDIWCAGPAGSEICVDASGNLIPTKDNGATLGTSSMRFADIKIVSATISDDITVTGDLFKLPASTQTLALSGTISLAGACGGLVRLNSLANITVALPSVSSTNAGCIYFVTVVTNSGTIGIATGAQFYSQGYPQVGTSAVTLGTNDVLAIANMGAAWVQLTTVVLNP